MADVSGDGDGFREPSELKFAEIGPSVRQPRRFHVTDYKGGADVDKELLRKTSDCHIEF